MFRWYNTVAAGCWLPDIEAGHKCQHGCPVLAQHNLCQCCHRASWPGAVPAAASFTGWHSLIFHTPHHSFLPQLTSSCVLSEVICFDPLWHLTCLRDIGVWEPRLWFNLPWQLSLTPVLNDVPLLLRIFLILIPLGLPPSQHERQHCIRNKKHRFWTLGLNSRSNCLPLDSFSPLCHSLPVYRMGV